MTLKKDVLNVSPCRRTSESVSPVASDRRADGVSEAKVKLVRLEADQPL